MPRRWAWSRHTQPSRPPEPPRPESRGRRRPPLRCRPLAVTGGRRSRASRTARCRARRTPAAARASPRKTCCRRATPPSGVLAGATTSARCGSWAPTPSACTTPSASRSKRTTARSWTTPAPWASASCRATTPRTPTTPGSARSMIATTLGRGPRCTASSTASSGAPSGIPRSRCSYCSTSPTSSTTPPSASRRDLGVTSRPRCRHWMASSPQRKRRASARGT
mmetsp:Transcript_55431/g.155558  ORF Transcript_55431/g.155558 Transcript_55431/m.155558 type:complete len:223 (-) Transcript_55431:867-1535(-)